MTTLQFGGMDQENPSIPEALTGLDPQKPVVGNAVTRGMSIDPSGGTARSHDRLHENFFASDRLPGNLCNAATWAPS
jgi:hypothetical protein